MKTLFQNILMEEAKGGEGGGASGGGGTNADGAGGNQGGSTSAAGGKTIDLSGGGSASAVSKGGKGESGNQAASGTGGSNDGAGGSGDGGKGGDWRTTLPENIRGAKSFEKFKDMASLAQGYLSLESAMGGKKLVVPDAATASEQDWNDFYKAIGRPENADKYELKVPEGVTAKVDEGFQKWFKSTAHKHGLPAKMAGALYSDYMKEMSTRMSAAENTKVEEAKRMTNELEQKWGANWNDNMNKAQVAMEHFLDKEEMDWAVKFGLTKHPMMARIFSKVGAGMAEDTFRGDANNPAIGRTANEIESEIGALRADMKGPYWNSDHPGHDAAKTKMHELTKELQKLKQKK